MDKLFIIDDDPLMLKFFEGLIGEDFELFLFKEPKASYAHLDKIVPDMIISDIMMPQMNGFQLGKLFKEDHRTKDVPLLYISALDSGESISECYHVGAVDYISKPINFIELKARVNFHLRLNHLQKELAEKNELLQMERDNLEQRVKESTEKLREKDVQLIEMDRLACTYTLAAGIAHEINTPLGIIKSGFFSLKKGFRILIDMIQFWDSLDLSDDTRENYKQFKNDNMVDTHLKTFDSRFNRIERGIQRISSIVSQFQSFGRFEAGDIAKIDVNKSLEEALTILTNTNDPEIIINKTFSELPEIECISIEIHHCFLQILRNAFDSVEKQGSITIKTSYDETSDHVLISVEDTGKGMSQQILKQVFNPFFTTKEIGKGTGLGLTISEKAIKSHGGNIMINSVVGKGTTVSIHLPVFPKQLQSRNELFSGGGHGCQDKKIT